MRRPSFPSSDAPAPGATRPAAGIWSLEGDRLTSVEHFEVGPAIVLVPTEQVLLATADLPLAGLRRRAAAVPFAIEDRVGAPLATVHVALGAELTPQRHLTGVVSHDLMRRWSDMLAEAGLTYGRLVPDVLALPMPSDGSWAVDLAAGRAMVRSGDGTGFALPADHLEAAWEMAGRPHCLSYGEPLPPPLAGDPVELERVTLVEHLMTPALDLRQGRYAPPKRGGSPLWRRIATIAAIGVIAHGAIAAADTLALDRIAARRAAETRALAVQVAPGIALDGDLAESVAQIVPAGGAGPSAFLPLLARVAAALKPLGPGTGLRSIAFDAAAGTLSIEVETQDMAALQRVGSALTASGLNALSGAASQDQGKAVGAFLVRGTA